MKDFVGMCKEAAIGRRAANFLDDAIQSMPAFASGAQVGSPGLRRVYQRVQAIAGRSPQAVADLQKGIVPPGGHMAVNRGSNFIGQRYGHASGPPASMLRQKSIMQSKNVPLPEARSSDAMNAMASNTQSLMQDERLFPTFAQQNPMV